jgi:dTDP-4-dehydrorhamnose 3,5-epimerase-like enzyme
MDTQLILGNRYSDVRGQLFYNNDFDASQVKRIYIIENNSTDFVRGWQGHQIEQRWFSAIEGKFKIELIQIDNWKQPSKDLKVYSYVINSDKLDVIHVPQGYVSSIQSLEEDSKLLVMTDYLLGEINDEFRYEIDYFKI